METGTFFAADVQDYAESILGVCDFSDLADALADTDNPDIEPFLDYLAFPDASLGIALEHYLVQPLSAADIAVIATHLEQHINGITIHNGTQRIACPLPDDMWDTFLSRLHLDDATVAALYDVAPQTVTILPATITHIIRCTSLPATPLTTDILLRCLTRLPQHDPVFPLLLETILSLLSSLPAKTACGVPPRIADLQAQLENSRRRLYKAILEAQEFTVKLQRFNMETLMMTGTIPPTINVDAARFQLCIIDRLAIALFGTPVASLDELEDRSWGDYADYRASLPLLPSNA